MQGNDTDLRQHRVAEQMEDKIRKVRSARRLMPCRQSYALQANNT